MEGTLFADTNQEYTSIKKDLRWCCSIGEEARGFGADRLGFRMFREAGATRGGLGKKRKERDRCAALARQSSIRSS